MISSTDSEQNQPRPSFGMDYAILPTIAVAADLRFRDMWMKAGFIAIGWGVLPSFNGIQNLPLITLVFTDLTTGVGIFKLIREWGNELDEGAGIDMALIGSDDRKSYYFAIAPGKPALLDRTIPKPIQAHYSPLMFVPMMGKQFDLSDGFKMFKNIVAGNKPVMILPGSLYAEPSIAEGFIKYDLELADLTQLEGDHWARTFVETMASGEKIHPFRPRKLPHPDDIKRSRFERLNRFFPVSLARLKHNKTLTILVKSLSDTHTEWQLSQAACNILCAERFPQFSRDTRFDFGSGYEDLVITPENSTDRASLSHVFTESELTRQIKDDVEYLWNGIFAGPGKSLPQTPEDELRQHGFL